MVIINVKNWGKLSLTDRDDIHMSELYVFARKKGREH